MIYQVICLCDLALKLLNEYDDILQTYTEFMLNWIVLLCSIHFSSF
jgi:hypothetical protein